MAIAIGATKTSLAASYVALGTWIGLATGSPGSTTTPANEATGGSPASARNQTSWSAGAAGVPTGTAQTIDVAAGTYSWMILASAATTGTTNGVDYSDITDVVMGAQGQIVVTPTLTIT